MVDLAREMEWFLDLAEEETEHMLEPRACTYVKNTKAMFRTPADIYDHPNSYSFLIDMLGLQVENVKVKLEDGVLHVAGRKKQKKSKEAGGEEEQKEVDVKPIRLERKAWYMRKFTLPKDADEDQLEASYKDGVLTVGVGKKKEATSKSKNVTMLVS